MEINSYAPEHPRSNPEVGDITKRVQRFTMHTYAVGEQKKLARLSMLLSGLDIGVAIKRLEHTLAAPVRASSQDEAEITRIVREADAEFETVGGSSRHWVRECFLPRLEAAGLHIVRAPVRAEETRASVAEVAIAEAAYFDGLCAARDKCIELGKEYGEHPEWSQTCADAIAEMIARCMAVKT